MAERLAGRVAVVTGAARGIGAAIARAYAAEGARVAVLDVLEREAAAVAATMPGGIALPVDLRDPAAARAAIDEVARLAGGLDVLVNNAGVFRSTPLLDLPLDEWDLVFDVNVRSVLVTTQAAAPHLAASGAGRIVNIASMGGKVGEPGQAHYAASKAAVIALTRVAAMELGADGTTVNCICPGYVATELAATTRTDGQVERWCEASVLGRLATPEDVAGMAVFLASSEADYCTGQALNVTGGMIYH